jgi:hypothetical protein
MKRKKNIKRIIGIKLMNEYITPPCAMGETEEAVDAAASNIISDRNRKIIPADDIRSRCGVKALPHVLRIYPGKKLFSAL